MTYSVKGKSAIITGAGSGINLSFATLLLSRGCNVLIADLHLRPEAKALLDHPAYSSPTSACRVYYLKTDVTSWSDLSRLFEFATERFGSVDIVCPGAGIYEPPSSNFWFPPPTTSSTSTAPSPSSSLSATTTTTTSKSGVPSIPEHQNSTANSDPLHNHPGTYKTLDVNITHPIRLTQLAIGYFLSQNVKDGRVVLVSSQSGSGEVGITTPLYYASKHAVHGFIKAMAGLEGELGIRVNGVAPGIVKTPLWLEAPEKLSTFSAENDTWVEPDVVANVMLDLLVKPEYVGDTILEVGAESVRRVLPCNDPGPAMGEKGFELSNLGVARRKVLDRLRGGDFVKGLWGGKSRI